MSNKKGLEESVKDLQDTVKNLKEQQDNYRERIEKLEREICNLWEITECFCSECDQKLTCTKRS